MLRDFALGLALLVASPAHGLAAPDLAAIDAALAQGLASGSPGMVVGVSSDDEVSVVRAYGSADLESERPVRPDTVFQIASLTKQFTAAAVLLMVEDGRLSLDDRLSRFVPELPQAGEVTIRQLLVQTSGLPDYAEDPAGEPLKSVAKTPAEMVAWIASLKPRFHFPPGSSWRYSNSNYALLGLVVERASGAPLAETFRTRLFAPAGMTQTAFDDPAQVIPGRARGYRKTDAPGGFANAAWISPTIPGPAGGLRSTVPDLLRWQAALHGGKILKPESLKLMTSPGRLSNGRSTMAGMPAPMQAGWKSDYGMGLMIGSPNGRPAIWHSGDVDGFSSWMAYYPAEKTSIVILQNSQSANRMEAAIEQSVFDGPSGASPP